MRPGGKERISQRVGVFILRGVSGLGNRGDIDP